MNKIDGKMRKKT